jgi:beta-glucanase (GH16 family)
MCCNGLMTWPLERGTLLRLAPHDDTHGTRTDRRMTTDTHGTAELVWADEFDGPAGSPPNPRWWGYEIGDHGWGNGELQRYTDTIGNAAQDGRGNLVIRALEEDVGYTSARLVSKDRLAVRYGRVECRVLLPRGAGLWSAVWMLGSDIDRTPWPACGEIDVMENLGAEPSRVFGTVHCPHHFGKGGLSGDDTDAGTSDPAYKVVAVDWTPDAIVWSVNGRRYHSVLARHGCSITHSTS